MDICLSSFIGILLGPSNLPTLNVLIISSVSSGVVGLKKKVFLDNRGTIFGTIFDSIFQAIVGVIPYQITHQKIFFNSVSPNWLIFGTSVA